MEHTITAGQIYRCVSSSYVYTDSLFRVLKVTPEEIVTELIVASEKAVENNRLVGYVSKLAPYRFKNIMTLEPYEEAKEHYETELTTTSFADLFGG